MPRSERRERRPEAAVSRRRLLRRRRVPVLRQRGVAECGATCLAMILGYFGRETSVAEVAGRVGSGRDGASARGLAEAARAFGLRCRGYSIEPADLGVLELPVIVHWRFNHFLVVERWTPRGAEVVDPAVGRRRLGPDEVDAGLTGVALALEPSSDFQAHRKSGRHPWRRYLASVAGRRGVRPALAQVALASLLLQAFGLALPLVTKLVVDRIIPGELSGALGVLGLGVAVWVAAQAATTLLRSALVIFLQGRLDAQMMVGFFEHLLALPYGFFQRRSVGDLAMRLASNALIRAVLTSQTVSLVLDSGFAVVYLVVLFALSPPFGAVVLVFGLLQVAVTAATTRPMHGLMQRDLAADAEQQSYLVEALKGVATIKAAGAEDRILDHWANLFFKQLNLTLQRARFNAVVETAMTALRTLAPLALLWFGTRQVLDGRLTLGTMLALAALAGSFLAPLASLVSTARQLQTVGARLERITDVLETDREQDPARVRPAPRLRGAIDVENLAFRYRPDGPRVLRSVSFSAAPGQKVALVGRTGSGKSTLAALLLGLYQPSEGRILYDGVPQGKLEARSLRGQLGVVLQESHLFAGSIRSNIAFNAPDLPFERVIEAARFAAIDRDVEAMPMGYETLLPEGGGALSGGERQRLSIARAVAPRPRVLLFDEATSHLDSETEAEIENHLSELEATRLVIAHRLSTVRDADLILVLDRGAVAERGTHEQLMSRGGLYAEMVRLQAEGSPSGGGSRSRESIFGLTAADRA